MVHDHPHKHSVSVSAIIFNDQGRVLATKRRDTGAWVPPGGVLHLHEPVEDGLLREVREETGLEIEIERLTGIYKNIATGVISLAFRCHTNGSTKLHESDEASNVSWISVEDANQRMAGPFAIRVNDALSDEPIRVRNISKANIMEPKRDHTY